MNRLISIITPAVLLFVMGCVGYSFAEVRRDLASGLDRGHYIENVPFTPAEEGDFCGPAALECILRFHGIAANQSELAAAVYSEEAKGAANVLLPAEARKRGLWAESASGAASDIFLLKEYVSEDIPVIVFVERVSIFGDLRHYLVLAGFDETKKVLIFHGSAEPNIVIDEKDFLGWWNTRAKWYMAVAPVSRPPAIEMIRRGIEFENAGDLESAKKSYTVAIERARTPFAKAVASANLGRLAIFKGNSHEAEDYLRKSKSNFEELFAADKEAMFAENTRRAYAEMLNALAWTLGVMQEKKDEALPLIKKALEIYPDNPDFLDTLEKISANKK